MCFISLHNYLTYNTLHIQCVFFFRANNNMMVQVEPIGMLNIGEEHAVGESTA